MDDDAPVDQEASVHAEASAPTGHHVIEMEPPNRATRQTIRSEGPNYPYHKETKRLLSRSHSHDDLKSLVKWTKRLIKPDCPSSGTNLRNRNKTNITIVEHMINAKPTFTSVDSVGKLRSALAAESTASQSHLVSAQPKLRLYIVEDLSVDVVELLGSQFNVDPMFFSTQYDRPGRIAEKHKFTRHLESSEGLRLQISKKHRKWFNMDNVRVSWEDGDEMEWKSINEQQNTFNVHRTMDHYIAPQRFGGTVLTLTTRTTFWLDKDGQGDSLVGIVLVDPTTPNFGSVYRDKAIPRPESKSDQAPIHETWYSDIVEISSRYLEISPLSPDTAINYMVVVYPVTIAVCAEWLKMRQAFNIILDDVESVFNYSVDQAEMRTVIDMNLTSLARLNLHLPRWKNMIVATLEDAFPAAAHLISSTSHKGQHEENDLLLGQVVPDLKRILHHLGELEARATRLTDRCVAEMQLQAARQSLAESHNLARLSWLATIFVPLTFLSGLFSMSQDIGSLQVSFKYYFSIGTPLVSVALVVARWGPSIAYKMERWFWLVVGFSIEFCFRWSYLKMAVHRHWILRSTWRWTIKRREKFS
ncbi:hypothetical protein HBH56_102690 [Parastagonospora nodorum]|uniref:Uncharacterized protein n=1 Tax=Phaeosphaeria nodorum (strain SN15 / ATCC MYA-4574 / FGSC 10173) TaxID=321614 RepID=A0A7U2I5V7_PHANO|nr:hypothetical protein HBH56_102690 [Parastagonospora nodorum]QRD04551.1 hypothetical protein JI435_104930 [Parastagonospora nodorum SN15]KAH3929413.1 hypothetical protein HBH54_127720 [Parastagonospora nodorum]KAH3975278.1 hypothetical protein HBH52_125120 [Parastagonospora nodorum]KAH4067816.1 hypothetical protein HBH50_132380 [Parastagonospora nodorum]